jgi:hypothetical protein
LTAGLLERSGKLRAAVQGVCAFASLDLNEHPDKLKALSGCEALQGVPLGLYAKARATLL